MLQNIIDTQLRGNDNTEYHYYVVVSFVYHNTILSHHPVSSVYFTQCHYRALLITNESTLRLDDITQYYCDIQTDGWMNRVFL